MNWRDESDKARPGTGAPVGLSSGSHSWLFPPGRNLADADDLTASSWSVAPALGWQVTAASGSANAFDAAELSVTIELPRVLAELEAGLSEGISASSAGAELPVADSATDALARLRLGSGLAARTDRHGDDVDGSTRWEQAAVAAAGGGVEVPLTPQMEDTDRFEVNLPLRQAVTGDSSPSSDVEGWLPNGSGGRTPHGHADPTLESADFADQGLNAGSRWLGVSWWYSLRGLLGSLASSAEAGGKMVDHAVGLAFGSSTTLTSETQKLLHQRLQVATSLLFFGFVVALFAEAFFFSGFGGRAEVMRFWSEVVLTTMMGLISWRLLSQCPHVFRNLRLVEFVVFASASWILTLNSWVVLEQGAAAKHAVSLSGPWQALVFTYALFIPNHWRRAMSGIAAMSFAPVAITLGAAVYSPMVGRLATESLDFVHGLVTLALMSGFATVAATWGVYSIGSLRSEAFSAKQFGQYRLSRLLGSGGMGEVYVGEHLLLKRPCAIKVIKPQQASDPKMLERFEREVRSTAKLTHWNTVAIYDYGRAEDGTFFYVMEYLPGLNLSQIVKMFGPLPPGRVVHLLVQICDALAEAHHHGMVHRDLKPANIFASKRGSKYDVAKLLDFGLVRRMVKRDGRGEAPTGAVGSPLYMSPEQALGRPMDHRSDIYSLGVTAYFLLTGQPPFRYAEPLKVLQAHATKAAPTFESLGVAVPEDLADVIQTCMQKRPEDRFANVEALRQALLSCRSVQNWTWQHSAQWWKLHRCPEKSSLDCAIENDRLVEWLAETEPGKAGGGATPAVAMPV